MRPITLVQTICLSTHFTGGSAKNSTNSSFRGAVRRSALRVLAIVFVTAVISRPSTAAADDIVLRWNREVGGGVSVEVPHRHRGRALTYRVMDRGLKCAVAVTQ